jgi:hypothetical protein
MNVLLIAWDTKPEAHQGDVPTSRTDTQNVFLCRGQLAAPAANPRSWHRDPWLDMDGLLRPLLVELGLLVGYRFDDSDWVLSKISNSRVTCGFPGL